MNTKTDEALIEDDGDEDQAPVKKYVAVEDDKPTAEASDEGGEEEEAEDSRLDADNEDREDIRRRRREEKAERAQRRKSAMERDKNELERIRRENHEMSQRLLAVEKQNANTQLQSLQGRLREAEEEVRAAEYVMAQATNAGNGDDVVKAMRIRDEAMARARDLTIANMRMTNQSRQQEPQRPAPEQNGLLDNVGHKLANDWAKMNDWFDPNGNDDRSKQVMKIDQNLINDGYNPNSLEYWQELTSQTRDLAPSRRTSSKGGPQMGSGRERAQGSSRNEVYISPERRKAMEETGAWEDPVRRQRMLKQYADWDRNNKSTR